MTRTTSAKRIKLVTAQPAGVASMPGHRTGIVCGREPEGWRVDYPGNTHGPVLARSTVSIPVEHAVDPLPVLLVFEEERSDRPIIVGVLQPSPPRSDVALEAQLDGKRVVLEAQDEIVLKCGKASITLRRNGRIVVRGSYLESDSTGVNRIRGASVRLN